MKKKWGFFIFSVQLLVQYACHIILLLINPAIILGDPAKGPIRDMAVNRLI